MMKMHGALLPDPQFITLLLVVLNSASGVIMLCFLNVKQRTWKTCIDCPAGNLYIYIYIYIYIYMSVL
jgi:hypothetical protein